MLDQIPLKIDREGIKEREDDEKRSGGGGEERLLFEEIRLLFEEIRYFCNDYSKEIQIVKCSSSAFNIAVQSFCLFVCLFVSFLQSEKKVIEISLSCTLIGLE